VNAYQLPREADAVFEGGGVKGIAFAGAIKSAEAAGVAEWKNVAGTSAGAIASCLLAVGYHATDLERIMTVDYRKFADYGFGGLPRGLLNSLWMRGLAPGRYFERWLRGHVAASPLAARLGRRDLTFADLARDDLPPGLADDDERRARYRLRVIASDVTEGRMLVLPQDITGFSATRNGDSLTPDRLSVVEAVRMSMSFPFLFTPVVLWKGDKPHFVVDGGLLSNFPVWLFDSSGAREPARPTWGFRVHGGLNPQELPPNRPVRLPFWRFALAKAMFHAASEAWDRDRAAHAQAVRTVDIPTGRISTTDFNLSTDDAEFLRHSGEVSARSFFDSASTAEYLAPFRHSPEPPSQVSADR
jgi:NTE family protein